MGEGEGDFHVFVAPPRGMMVPRFREDGVWTPAGVCPRMFLSGEGVTWFLTFYEFINPYTGYFIGVDKSLRNVGYPNEAVVFF